MAKKKAEENPLVKALQKAHGVTAASMGVAHQTAIEVIPTSIEVMNKYILGCGGLPVGRVVEMYSEEGTGKTSLMHAWCADAQRNGGLAILAETEESFDAERAETFGVDLDKLILLNPGTIEKTLAMIETTLDNLRNATSKPAVIGWDSVAGTPTAREIEEGITGKQKVGDRSKTLSHAMRVLAKRINKNRACLVCVNQIRDNVGVMFGDKQVTPGGHAIKFHASIRLQLMGGKGVKDGDQHTGKLITALCTKNRFSPPWRKALIRLDFATGLNDDWTTFNFAKDRGVIDKGIRFSPKAAKEARAAMDGMWAPLGRLMKKDEV